MDKIYNILDSKYNIRKNIIDYVCNIEESLENTFKEHSKISEYNQIKILKAMQEVRLQATDFNWTTGYGYGDVGRDKVEDIYKIIFNTEDALVRPNIVSGTHAIYLAISSLLNPGDHLLSITGSPYDTLQKIIGVRGEEDDSLIKKGIEYSELSLKDKLIDINNIKNSIRQNTKIIMIQRSTGYSNRRAFTISEIEKAVDEIRKVKQDVYIFVDNCYGEFTEYSEPSELDIDIMAGSLIKNPGGGLAYSGGYIVGKKILINKCANKLTAPGIGKECGLTFGMTRQILQGLFMSSEVVFDAIKGALLFSRAFENLGYETIPKSTDKRSDIITAIKLKNPEVLEEFCKFIQFSSPVDSIFTPQPWDMPGYDDKIIMAAGGFIEGSSIELSADGPLRDPYYVYFQGGLSYYHIKFSLMNVLNNLNNLGYIKI